MWTFNKNYLLSVLGLCCCEQAFSSCGKQELLPSYGVWASNCCDFSCCRTWALRHAGFICGTRAQELRHMGLVAHGMWNLHRPGIEPMSLALAGGFLVTGPPGKSKVSLF